jgi:hypothetical protein
MQVPPRAPLGSDRATLAAVTVELQVNIINPPGAESAWPLTKREASPARSTGVSRGVTSA